MCFSGSRSLLMSLWRETQRSDFLWSFCWVRQNHINRNQRDPSGSENFLVEGMLQLNVSSSFKMYPLCVLSSTRWRCVSPSSPPVTVRVCESMIFCNTQVFKVGGGSLQGGRFRGGSVTGKWKKKSDNLLLH